MIKPMRCALVGAAVFSLFGSAHATSSVVASLTLLTISTTGTIIETSDYAATTMAETYDFVPNGGVGYDAGFDAVNHQSNESNSAPEPPISSDAVGTYAAAHAEASSTSLVAEATTGVNGGRASASATLTKYFSLAAHSSVTITWSASVVGSNTSNGALTDYYYTDDLMDGSASASLGLLTSLTEARFGGYYHYDSDDLSFSFEESVSGKKLTVQTGADARYFPLTVGVSAYTEDYANPVPEPETWALALAGLGLAGAVARRRLNH